MVSDMVTNMELDMVADMEVDKVARVAFVTNFCTFGCFWVKDKYQVWRSTA